MAAQTISQRLHATLSRLIANTPPGNRLPAEPALAKELGVSRATLREAMRPFEIQGLIRRRQGSGTYVNHPVYVFESGLEVLESINTLAERTGLPVKTSSLKLNTRSASEQEKHVFGLVEGDLVTHVERVIETGDQPVAYLIDILPAETLPAEQIRTSFSGSVLDWLLQRGDPKLVVSRAEILVEPARTRVAKALNIRRGDVLLCFLARLYSDEGLVVDISTSYFLPGHFRFHIVRKVG